MNANTKARNRRMSQRREARSSVRVECRKGSLGLAKNIGDKLLDLSEEGVRLTLKETVPLNQEVEVTIHPINGHPIKRIGQVVWIVPIEGGGFCAGVRLEKRIRYVDVTSLGR